MEADGFRYEDLVTALVFLRCFRRDLPDFQVTCNTSDTSRFNDVGVIWSGNRCKYALFVQLKHAASRESQEIRKTHLFSKSGTNKSAFNINKYHDYYKRVEKRLRGTGIQYSLAVSTNLTLHHNGWGCFDERHVDSLVGAELLHTGGSIFVLKPLVDKNKFDPGFMERFFLFCGQKGVNGIRDDICRELKQLLRSRPAETDGAFRELCERVQKWKTRQCTNPESLTSNWSEWRDIESKYKSRS